MRNLLIINVQSAHFPFSNLRGELASHCAFVRTRLERRADCRMSGFSRVAPAHAWHGEQVVPDCQKATLQVIICGRVGQDRVLYSDGWRGYEGLVDMGYGRHFNAAHGRAECMLGAVHINGIQGFRGVAKSRLAQYRGMNKKTFYLDLKECEQWLRQAFGVAGQTAVDFLLGKTTVRMVPHSGQASVQFLEVHHCSGFYLVEKPKNAVALDRLCNRKLSQFIVAGQQDPGQGSRECES